MFVFKVPEGVLEGKLFATGRYESAYKMYDKPFPNGHLEWQRY